MISARNQTLLLEIKDVKDINGLSDYTFWVFAIRQYPSTYRLLALMNGLMPSIRRGMLLSLIIIDDEIRMETTTKNKFSKTNSGNPDLRLISTASH